MKPLDVHIYEYATAIYSDKSYNDMREQLQRDSAFASFSDEPKDEAIKDEITNKMLEWKYEQFKIAVIKNICEARSLMMAIKGMQEADIVGLMRILIPLVAVNNSVGWTKKDSGATLFQYNDFNCQSDDFINMAREVPGGGELQRIMQKRGTRCDRVLSHYGLYYNSSSFYLKYRYDYEFVEDYKIVDSMFSHDLSFMSIEHREEASLEQIKVFHYAVCTLFEADSIRQQIDVDTKSPIFIAMLSQYIGENADPKYITIIREAASSNIKLAVVLSHICDMQPSVYRAETIFRISSELLNNVYVQLDERPISTLIKYYAKKRYEAENPTPKVSSSQITASSKGGCFIATACYGGYDSPQVLLLRRYRDEVMLTNTAGTMFVKAYYLLSPKMATFISSRPRLAEFIKVWLIDNIVKYAEERIK